MNTCTANQGHEIDTINTVLNRLHFKTTNYKPVNLHAAHYKLGLEKAEEFIRIWFKDLNVKL